MAEKIIKNLSELKNKELQALSLLSVLEINNYLGCKCTVSETYRTQKRQDELYAQGRTKAGKVVTWTKKSLHTERVALDIYPIRNNEISSLDKDYKNIAKIMKKYGFENGYDWKVTQDKPHHQHNLSKLNEKLIKAFFTYLSIFEPHYKKANNYKLNGKVGKGKTAVWKALCKKEFGKQKTLNADNIFLYLSRKNPVDVIRYW